MEETLQLPQTERKKRTFDRCFKMDCFGLDGAGSHPLFLWVYRLGAGGVHHAGAPVGKPVPVLCGGGLCPRTTANGTFAHLGHWGGHGRCADGVYVCAGAAAAGWVLPLTTGCC